MAIAVAPKRRRRLSMTSLIDVIFLLLLFFMLTSTFSRYGDIELLAAGAAGGSDQPVQRQFLTFRDGALLLNAQAVNPADLPNRLAEFEAPVVLISLDAQTTSQQLVDVLAVLRGVAGARTVVLE